jgi:hypothetical protein
MLELEWAASTQGVGTYRGLDAGEFRDGTPSRLGIATPVETSLVLRVQEHGQRSEERVLCKVK